MGRETLYPITVLLCCRPELAHSISPSALIVRRTHQLPVTDVFASAPPTTTRALRTSHLSMRSGTSASKDSVGEAGFTATVIGLWYGVSIFNNQCTKLLVPLLGAELLTLSQLIIASACGAAVRSQLVAAPTHGAESGACANVFGGDILTPLFTVLGFTSRAAILDTAQLAAAFLAGCYTLNACLGSMHVSLAMVLRSAEPLTTLCLGTLLLPPSEQPAPRKLYALLPVVIGCSLSAVGAHGPSARALLLVSASNICFSLRGILGRRVKAAHGTGPIQLFFQMCVLGAAMQVFLLFCRVLVSGGSATGASLISTLRLRPGTLLLCGLSFYSQLQLSFICLGRMSAVSHSLVNSMRRPATIAAAIAFAPAPLTALNWAGVVVACVGALLYGML